MTTSVVVVASVINVARSKSKTFDSSFSTVLRTTRDPELSVSERSIALAKHLANTRLRLQDSQLITADVVSAKEEDGSAIRTFFIVVKDNETAHHPDDLAEQSVGDYEGKMGLVDSADVDSLLVLEEESDQYAQTGVSLHTIETTSVLSERLVGR